MINLDPTLVPYMTESVLCPFHKVGLIENNKADPFTPLWCSNQNCLFGLRAVKWLPNYNDAHNVMEFFVEGHRIWTFYKAKPGPNQIGPKEDPYIKRCVFLPLENVDFSDMEKMYVKIRTILTFS